MPLVRRALIASCALGALSWGGYASYENLQARTVAAETNVDLTTTSTVEITGGGFGHGHGMSQYGAAGAASQGLNHRQILAFYYPGTKLTTEHRSISVLVSADTTDDVVVRARGGLKVTQLSPKRSLALPKVTGKWRLVSAARGRTLVQRSVGGGWRTWRTMQGAVQFHGGGPVTLVLPDGSNRAYRGALRSAPVAKGSATRDTVNVVSREKYLRGVVPAEMPASWPANAVRSQAVAARTYAAHEQRQPLAGHYQVCDTTQCQVYAGVSGEHPLGNAAVKATSGQILMVGGRPAFTQFSASNGGWMSAGSVPYLVAKQDPYDAWSRNPVNRWKVSVPKAKIRSAWPAVGRPESVRVLSRDGQGAWGGRVRSLKITGSSGSVTVSGDDFRFLLGLRSNYFTFTASSPAAS